MSDKEITGTLRTDTRMDADQENALLELEDIVHLRTMAAVSYDLDIEEVWEFLDIWAAVGNAEATKLLAGLKSTVVRAGPARIDR